MSIYYPAHTKWDAIDKLFDVVADAWQSFAGPYIIEYEFGDCWFALEDEYCDLDVAIADIEEWFSADFDSEPIRYRIVESDGSVIYYH